MSSEWHPTHHRAQPSKPSPTQPATSRCPPSLATCPCRPCLGFRASITSRSQCPVFQGSHCAFPLGLGYPVLCLQGLVYPLLFQWSMGFPFHSKSGLGCPVLTLQGLGCPLLFQWGLGFCLNSPPYLGCQVLSRGQPLHLYFIQAIGTSTTTFKKTSTQLRSESGPGNPPSKPRQC